MFSFNFLTCAWSGHGNRLLFWTISRGACTELLCSSIKYTQLNTQRRRRESICVTGVTQICRVGKNPIHTAQESRILWLQDQKIARKGQRIILLFFKCSKFTDEDQSFHHFPPKAINIMDNKSLIYCFWKGNHLNHSFTAGDCNSDWALTPTVDGNGWWQHFRRHLETEPVVLTRVTLYGPKQLMGIQKTERYHAHKIPLSHCMKISRGHF